MPDSAPLFEPAVAFPGAAGEMASLVRATDWSRTPLGPIEAWPHSLRALVGVILEHPMPSILLWGPELTQVYNDAYAVLAAAKHPAALGMATRQCWPEVWHINQPIYEAVLSRGESVLREDALYPLERHGAGRAEKVYLTISYSPARDDAGRIAGVFITITETTRKVIAEEHLRQSQALLAESQALAHIGSWSWDVRTNMIAWSDEHYRIFGLEPNPGPVRAEWAIGFIHPDDRDVLLEAMKQAVNDREPYDHSLRIVRADGVERIVHSRGRAEYDGHEGGPPLRIFGTVQDVTDRLRAEAAARVATERLELAMRGSSIGIWDLQLAPGGEYRQGPVEFINIWEALGYARNEFPRDAAASRALGHPDDLVEVDRAVAACLAGETQEISVENRIRHKDGSWRWFLTLGKAVQDHAGKPARLVGIVLDITERKQTEEALRASEERLAAELGEMSRLGQVSTRLVQEGDSQSLLLDIVDAAIAITAADMGNIQLLDRGSRALRVVASRGFAEPFLDFFSAVHETKTTCGTAMRNGGRVVVEDVTTSPIFADAPALGVLLEAGVRAVQSTPLISRFGQLVGMLSTHYRAPRVPGERDLRVLDLLARQAADWIERIEAQAAVERAKEAAERAKEAAERANLLKDSFLATVSHELRTPLAGMLLWAQILESHTLSSADADKALASIRQSAQVQQQLIDDLLDISRILAGEMRLDRHQTDLAAVVQDAVNVVRPAADAKQIRIEESLDPRVPRLSVDAARMQQVVLNLLNNAIKFSPEGGRVTVRLERAAGGVQVQVTDAGQGIAPDFLPHIFKRFRQAESSYARRHGGLGLGLAIARELVELHDGSIRAESPGIGKGATFTVELPVREAPSDHSVEGRPADPAETAWRFTPSPVLRGVGALVVEDDATSRDAIQYLLQQCEAEVTAVDSASDALREYESHLRRGRRFDVVLSDIGLPETSGHELARQIRAAEQRAGQHPAVAIALTAYAREQDLADALAAGFNAHLSKPVRAATLISTVARYLQR